MITSSYYSGNGENNGLYGNPGVNTVTYFIWPIYIQSLTQPATPTGGSWNFTTNVGTPPSGWSATPITSTGNDVWVSVSVVNSTAPTTLNWSTSALYFAPPIGGPTGPTGPLGPTGPYGGPTGPTGPLAYSGLPILLYSGVTRVVLAVNSYIQVLLYSGATVNVPLV